MSSSDIARRLRDIIENADRVNDYVAGMDLDAFGRDQKTLDAAERSLERIAEAVVKIGAERMATVIPELSFERVRGLGNMLRDAYDEIDVAILYNVIRTQLPILRDAAARALES